MDDFSDEDEIAMEVNDIQINCFSKVLRYTEQQQKFLLSNVDDYGFEKVHVLKTHLDKEVCSVKNKNQTLLTDYFS